MTAPALSSRRDEVVRDWVVLLFAFATLGVVVSYRHWPTSRLWIPAALAGIALAVWHGAYDTVLARDLWQPRYAGKWLLPFVIAYVGLAAVVVVAWYTIPVAALVAFLLYSGLHFGTETARRGDLLQTASAFAFGCLPIAAACCWQASSVAPIFSAMLRGDGDAAARITAVAGTLLVPCILLAFAFAVRDGRELARRALLTISLLLLFRFCPPVVAFAVFFCLLHTPEHLVETSRTVTRAFSTVRMRRNLRAGIGPWLISLAAVAVAIWMGRRTVLADTAFLFIALSALTVPHMVLAMLATAETNRNRGLPFRSAQGAVQS